MKPYCTTGQGKRWTKQDIIKVMRECKPDPGPIYYNDKAYRIEFDTVTEVRA